MGAGSWGRRSSVPARCGKGATPRSSPGPGPRPARDRPVLDDQWLFERRHNCCLHRGTPFRSHMNEGQSARWLGCWVRANGHCAPQPSARLLGTIGVRSGVQRGSTARALAAIARGVGPLPAGPFGPGHARPNVVCWDCRNARLGRAGTDGTRRVRSAQPGKAHLSCLPAGWEH
jgi:hypothetical protein